MSKVVMYSSAFCPYCHRAKSILDSKGVNVEEIFVDRKPDIRQTMMDKSGRNTVPQIWIGDTHVGGSDDLWALDRNGDLDPMLAKLAG
ncbi:Glutaredoxin 3 [Sinobacterium norvegicum]|uniref:Glutaredoxin n=1 Tax=Sinobacterium norvegicum TaxID=1641715 RepID=A0ABM9AI28_9GAMM|nr:glutaredoxin 3 [Sinobacterium norvegicum]CAH0992887.1 Glutaredoxin 3 [Sinobacterium norvegicum]